MGSRVKQIEVTAFSNDSIDQHPVELDVTFAEVFVVAGELVVLVLWVKLLALGELFNHVVEKANVKSSFFRLMVRFFVPVGILNAVHGLRRLFFQDIR